MTLGFLTPLLVPPAGLAVAGLAALLLRRRVPAALLLAGFLILGMPAVSGALLASLAVAEPAEPPPEDAAPAQAIVVLGAEVERDAGGRTLPGPLSLQRIRAAAELARQTGLPLATSGGVTQDGADPVGVAMAASLARDFGRPARWVEDRSVDTWQNATLSAALLQPAGIRDVLVVTHPWHMRRALLAFAGTALHARPASGWATSLAPARAGRFEPGDLVPRPGAWQASYYALHEWLGIGWYLVRARIRAGGR